MSDYWSRKLGTPQPPAAPPQRREIARPQQQQQEVESYPEDDTPFQRAMRAAQATGGSKKMRAADVGNCPECDSPRYMVPPAEGMRRMEPAARCYDCGYPIVQSGSGVSAASSNGGPVTAARQLPGSKPLSANWMNE